MKSPEIHPIEFLTEIDKNGLDREDLVIGLKGKARVVKREGRFFSLMSWKLWMSFVMTEYLIKIFNVPLFEGLTMADDLLTVANKMINNLQGQESTDYKRICVADHLDYSSWNHHQRYESTYPVFKVMGQFLGLPNLFVRAHEFFQKSLV